MTVGTPSTFRRSGLRAALAPWRSKSEMLAVGLFLLDCASFLAMEAVAIFAPSLFWRSVGALAASLFITRLFILAHDACHGSLFSRRWLNQFLGRLAFLPSLTPFSLWHAGHNVIHHGFTNLKGRDWSWTPLTKAEYDQLSPLRRLLERLYRSASGLGLYYGVELWWKRMIVPDRAYLPPKRTILKKDMALVIGFAIAEILLLCGIARASGQSPVVVLFFGLILPFAGWLQIAGLVTHQQHTHPSVAWYDNRMEWSLNEAAVRSSTHVVFPGPVNALLHNVMEHTAHHAEVAIPLHQLPGAQAAIAGAFPEDVLVQRWSFAFFRNCLRVCKLYDYDQHCWTDFDGVVTAVVPSVRRLAARDRMDKEKQQ